MGLFNIQKPFIFQEYIPAIEGNIVFPDRSSARNTGKMVIKKLNKKILPVVSKEELIHYGIVNNESFSVK